MLELRCAFSDNPRVRPLAEGVVRPRGCRLSFAFDAPPHWFERHLRESAFDVFEFSLAHYLITRDRPRPTWDWVALPLFLSKALGGLRTWVRPAAGISRPEDVRGKRFGIPDFTMTAGLWLRVMLREVAGVDASELRWFVGRARGHSQGVLLGVDRQSLPGLSVTWLYEAGALDRLLRTGQLDLAFATDEDPIHAEDGGLEPLFADGGQRFVRAFFERRGFVPANHTVLVQRRLAEAHPWLPAALYEAFERSKTEAYRRDPRTRAVFPDADLPAQLDLYGEDPYVSGLAANRSMVALAAEQSAREGTIAHPPDVDRLFWPSLRET
jgi:4,5-dihydroxyphthalate decarboxylase